MTYNYLKSKDIDRLTYFDFESDNCDILYDYDIVFIAGWNPYYLFHYCHQGRFDIVSRKLLGSKKIIIAVSAGALFFSKGIQYVEEFNQSMSFESRFYTYRKFAGNERFEYDIVPSL